MDVYCEKHEKLIIFCIIFGLLSFPLLLTGLIVWCMEYMDTITFAGFLIHHIGNFISNFIYFCTRLI